MSRRSKAQWRELISEQQASGLSAAEFCRRESINPKYFSLRKGKLTAANSAFSEVTRSSIETVHAMPGRIKVRVIELEVSRDALAVVLEQLRQ